MLIHVHHVLIALSVLNLGNAESSSVECKEDGYLPDPAECAAYYVCSGGIPTRHKCPPHLRFRQISTKSVFCDIPDKVSCPPHADVTKTAHEFCAGKQNGLFAIPEICSKFIMCSSGTSVEFSCPEGMGFSSNEKICAKNPYCGKDGNSFDDVTDDDMGSGDVMDGHVPLDSSSLKGDDEDELGSGEVLGEDYSPEDYSLEAQAVQLTREDPVDGLIRRMYNFLLLWKLLTGQETREPSTEFDFNERDGLQRHDPDSAHFY